jgi:hypothetical protein
MKYDIAIIGGSLTARIAAALLAKQGNKVLFLRNREARAPAWFHSSIFLEKLLGVLGGRSCFVAQNPIQVISEKSRLTLSSDVPVGGELTREFGEAGPAVERWLSELRQLGTQLEELLWENGGLPWPSFKSSAGFKLLCMRRRINLAELEQPVNNRLPEIPASASMFLADLLQGLSLTKLTELSYARAAMLWAQALRPENLVEPDFSLMLKKRFEQFHGSKASLDDLDTLEYDGSRWTGGCFKSGGRFTARHFLLGDKRWFDLFKAGGDSPGSVPQSPTSYRTSNLSGQLSPLLGKRVICGGKLPMRLAIADEEQELRGLVLSCQGATEQDLRRQLEQVLPFAKYQLSQETETTEQHTEFSQVTTLANLPIRISANLYCADRTVLLPEMGAAGAALLAWTIAKNLGNSNNEAKAG